LRRECVRYYADVKFYTFEIVIEKEEEDEGYLAYSPTPAGCFSNGKTIERPGGTSARQSSSTSRPCSPTGSRSRRMRNSCTSRS